MSDLNKNMDNIHKYPLSSCDCYQCSKNLFMLPLGVPTNFSVRNCDVSPYYDCNYKRIFKNQIEPIDKKGIDIINPKVVTEKFSNRYYELSSESCPGGNCPGRTTYSNSDARLLDAPRAIRTQLDRPPLTSQVKLNTLHTDSRLNCYGQNYRTYEDINAGDILYYTDKSREDAFYKPNFTTPAQSVGWMYQDPMGNMKPSYQRIPLKESNPLTDCDEKYDYCLSFIQDTMRHREDLNSKQQWFINQTRWTPRWTNECL